MYMRTLKASGRFFRLQPGRAYILADCSATGELVRGYCLLQPITFRNLSSPSTEEITLLTCSCVQAMEQSRRLCLTCDVISSEDISAFKSREEALYCIHRRVWDHLQFETVPTDDSEGTSDDEAAVDILTLDPLLAAVYDGCNYGLVGRKRTPKLQCFLCDGHCGHVQQFEEWCEENEIDLALDIGDTRRTEVTYPSHSYRYVLRVRVNVIPTAHQQV